VELEPKSLGVPLYRRNHSRWLFPVLCGAFGWLWHKPTQLPQILVSLVVGGAVFWLSIGPGLNQLKYHTSRLVRLGFFVGSLVLVYAVMKHLVPLLHVHVAS
jgi:hypothetical protein